MTGNRIYYGTGLQGRVMAEAVRPGGPAIVLRRPCCERESISDSSACCCALHGGRHFSEKKLLPKTNEHVDKFAKEGLINQLALS